MSSQLFALFTLIVRKREVMLIHCLKRQTKQKKKENWKSGLMVRLDTELLVEVLACRLIERSNVSKRNHGRMMRGRGTRVWSRE